MALSEDDIRRALVAGYIGAAARDLKVADLIAASGDPDVSALAAYHVQQCAEKLTKAIFAARDFTITKEHRLEVNIKVVAGETLAEPLAWFVRYDRFATSTRYPSSVGRLATGPSREELTDDLQKLRALMTKARAELSVPESRTRSRSR